MGRGRGGREERKKKEKKEKANIKADRCKGGCEKEGNKIKGSKAADIVRAGKLRGEAR